MSEVQQNQGIVTSEKLDGSWQALHEPSGRVTHGMTENEALTSMDQELGRDASGQFTEPATSEMFDGVAKDIALHLEGPVSEMLAFHSGFARLDSYHDGGRDDSFGRWLPRLPLVKTDSNWWRLPGSSGCLRRRGRSRSPASSRLEKIGPSGGLITF